MDEEISDQEHEHNDESNSKPRPEPLSLCKCLIDEPSAEEVFISKRKQHILSTVSRTEKYLRERRIPELVRFLLTKLIAQESNKPIIYMEKLLNDCMLFRAGHGVAPVLYEKRHLEAIVKSFDPGQRGWLSAGQTRRAFVTLGLTPDEDLDDRVPCDLVIEKLCTTQELELFSLLSAGMNIRGDSPDSTEINSDI